MIVEFRLEGNERRIVATSLYIQGVSYVLIEMFFGKKFIDSGFVPQDLKRSCPHCGKTIFDNGKFKFFIENVDLRRREIEFEFFVNCPCGMLTKEKRKSTVPAIGNPMMN